MAQNFSLGHILIGFVVVAVGFNYIKEKVAPSEDTVAKNAGFEDAIDQKNAGQAGISDVRAWKTKLADDKAKADEVQKAERAKKDAECKNDLSCWGEKGSSAAGVYCRSHVEDLAKYTSKWTDGWLEPKFSRYRWKDKSAATVTYIGDKIEFQNGFGAYQNHIYNCDFDLSNNTVLSVSAYPGRLPR